MILLHIFCKFIFTKLLGLIPTVREPSNSDFCYLKNFKGPMEFESTESAETQQKLEESLVGLQYTYQIFYFRFIIKLKSMEQSPMT
jgi:hypothetical protein